MAWQPVVGPIVDRWMAWHGIERAFALFKLMLLLAAVTDSNSPDDSVPAAVAGNLQ